MRETVLYDGRETARLLDRFLADLAALVLGEGSKRRPWALVGIQRRGDILAARLRHLVEAEGGAAIPLGTLDITLYRDDFSPDRPQPTLRPSKIDFSIEGARILLVDDVFQTGRTIRAALNQLADFGRARQVVLGVFIERGMRELPIRPDHVGLVIERPPEERVQLRLREIDGKDEIVAQSEEGGSG